MSMQPDAYIKVRFRTTEEGGRKKSVSGHMYACPLILDNEAYDCRLLIHDVVMELGQFYVVPVKFLNRDLVLPKLAVGKKVVLWEGKNIADGTITQVIRS